MMAQDSTGRVKAQALVAAYAKHVGVHDALHRTLDAENERAFGDFQISIPSQAGCAASKGLHHLCGPAGRT